MKKNNMKLLSHIAEHQARMCRYEVAIAAIEPKKKVANISELKLQLELEKGDELIEDIFPEKELNELDAIPKSKSHDRHFVSLSLKILYKQNLQALYERSLKRTNGINTKTISPKKLQLIYSLLHRRFEAIEDVGEKTERMDEKYIRQTISRALTHERMSNKIN